MVLIAGTIDLTNLDNYANQAIPAYITEDNMPTANPITDAGATLGRVLFYDKNLSANGTVSCGSCHKQEFAFGDTALQSTGLTGGLTGRHSTRLINARFGEEEKFFWDERAASLEAQTTMPIQDHVEMGFSGTNGDPDLDSLIRKLANISYYQDLFTFVYGDAAITEARMQDALAQFIRSIQSFDSKYDVGRAQVNNQNANFPNFTTEENAGKTLFTASPANGGAGCQACHRAPEFDIDPNSRNNGIIGNLNNPTGVDLTNTRSPTLRDLINPNGVQNGPMMHDGSTVTMLDMINHYDQITIDPLNNNLDPRLRGGPGGNGQNLGLTTAEKDALIAFMGTLTGSNVYTDARWSDPFDASGNLTLITGALPVEIVDFEAFPGANQVSLSWLTLEEINNDGFEVQHSENAIDWEAIGFVPGTGTTDAPTAYAFDHDAPINGVNYYRLKQLDIDGTVSYSHTLSQFLELNAIAMRFYPNPVQDFLNVELPTGDYSVRIMDMKGRILANMASFDQSQIDFSNEVPGLYFLQVKDNITQEVVVKKITKR